MRSGHTFIDHTGDVGLKIWGADIPDLFCEAALAMCSLIFEAKPVLEGKEIDIRVESADRDALLLKWLKEILFLIETERIVFSQFHIENHNFTQKDASTYVLEAKAYGEPLNAARHSICKEIKAVTYHHFYVRKNGEWWESAVVFDI